MRDEVQSCEQILKIFARDFKDKEEFGNDRFLSQDDKRALYILNSTLKRENRDFSVGILWKDDSTLKSDGRNLEEKYLAGLKRRFCKDPKLFQKYAEKMSEKINKYAEPAPTDTKTGNPKRRRYIPHHCTAQTSRFRIVFNCSVCCKGESLRFLWCPNNNMNLPLIACAHTCLKQDHLRAALLSHSERQQVRIR